MYLFDEVQELRDKLEQPGGKTIQTVGFVTDQVPDLRQEVVDAVEDLKADFEVECEILSFTEWVERMASNVAAGERSKLAASWLVAYAESLALYRKEVAPIDEPTERWLRELLPLVV